MSSNHQFLHVEIIIKIIYLYFAWRISIWSRQILHKHTHTDNQKAIILGTWCSFTFFSFDSIAKQTILNLIFFLHRSSYPEKTRFIFFFCKIMKNDSANRWWKIQGSDFYHHVWLLWRIFFLFFFLHFKSIQRERVSIPLNHFFSFKERAKTNNKMFNTVMVNIFVFHFQISILFDRKEFLKKNSNIFLWSNHLLMGLLFHFTSFHFNS